MSDPGIGWLDGDVAFITGAGSGIGQAVALRFLQEGAKGVAILGRDPGRLESTVTAAGTGADRLLPLVGDVRSSADLQAAVDATIGRFGKLDVLVPNAGVWDFNKSISRTTPDEIEAIYDELFDINVKGYLLTVSTAWRALVESHGNIVMTLSNAAFYAAGGGPVYTAAKHATRGLVTQLAYELAPKVRVNGVAIGGLRTDLRGPASTGMSERSIEQSFAKHDDGRGPNLWLPLHHASPDPVDSTGPYVLLASRRNASVITGAVVNADGGIGVRGFASAAGGDQL
ncbi:Cis-2,3-dihydrobiphenyl-2,3-diol dehydrogenase [Microbacterium azadirachtae]|uniref:Cis-2,3-dihydrobiphenyl-2,3-diol dehydrogenase n=1 Tax=Microbacterium azadirachtae TaxID=582680 RepID=A0A0F0L4Y4_9MICO|nr:SDR family NAD(P)-dependent oxidoreductase [Microbacterium azadirachtae]KJL26606.1 Cis-2,3-dihydrobiphenyl-2,3-diol dehydrogenase [Microbacterium azadirachtae]